MTGKSDDIDDTYVTQAGWLRTVGRVDLIDDVADHFEHPVTSVWPDGRGDFWGDVAHRWPRSTGALRSAGLLHTRAVERRTP